MKFAMDNGMINLSDVQEQWNMSRLSQALKKHKFSIWKGDNGLWYTYLPDDTKRNNRRLAKRKSKEKIHLLLIEFYDAPEDEDESITFKDMFESYKLLKSEILSDNTVDKYDSDYRRFFSGTWLETTDMDSIKGDKLDVYIIKRIKKLELNQRAAKAMLGYIRAVFMHARINEKMQSNPCDFLKKDSAYYRYCYSKLVDTSKRIANRNEVKMLLEQIRKDQLYKPKYIPSYAVELALYTGMRVGELAALRWDAITDDIINVCREEIFNRRKNLYYVEEYTKNKRPRVIPITNEVRELLKKIETVEKNCGYYGQYVFMGKNGKINKRTIGDCARNKSIQSGIENSKSIHCLRRTLNSNMRCNGVSVTVASAILGNSEIVNEQDYSYDVTDIEEKREILKTVNQMMTI